MPDNYTVLAGKYQRALISIRELEQERDRIEKEAGEQQKRFTLLEKNIRYLCETIEKKNHVRAPKDGESRSGDEKTWGKTSTFDLIKKAQDTLENYFPSLDNTIRKLITLTQKRTEKIEQLEAQIEDMKRSNASAIQKLSQQAENGADDKQVQKVARAITNMETVNIDMNPSGDIEFSAEDEDDIESQITDAIEVISQEGDILRQLPKGPKMRLNTKAKEVVHTKTKEVLLKNATVVAERAKTLTKVQKYLIQTIGETGFSETTALIEETKKKHPDVPSDSRIKSAMYDLSTAEMDKRIIDSARCSVPGFPHYKVYKLSAIGRDIYMYLFGMEAAEAEMDMIKKNHGTLEHGYGIRQTANLMKQSSYIREDDDVIYLTRAKEHSVKLGENLSYIPDIIIKQFRNGKEKLFYIEYETGKCSDIAFFEKCNKIASFSKFINIIVPSNDAKTVTVEKIEKWKEKIQDGSYPLDHAVKFMLSTYSELKDGVKDTRFPWKWEKNISPKK